MERTDKFVEQESIPHRVTIVDPPYRNGLQFKKIKSDSEVDKNAIVQWQNIQGNPTDNQRLLAILENVQPRIGYIPLDQASNLSDLLDIAVARENLGLTLNGSGDIWIARSGGIMSGTLTLESLFPLQFSGLPLPVSPAQGMMEFDGKQLYFTQSTVRRAYSFISESIVSSTTVANTTTETVIYTTDIPAAALAVEQILRLLLYGRYSTANGTDTFTLKIKIGGTTILSIVSTAAAVTNAPLAATLTATIRQIGASGTLWGFIEAAINNVKKDKPATGTTSIDTTTILTVEATVTWSAADPGNTVSLDQALLNTN